VIPGSEIAELFSEDDRIMWPSNKDIVGSEAIRKAWIYFVNRFHPIFWKPRRQKIYIYENQAFLYYNFIEIREFKET
jgi:hypothetical protein